MARNSATLIPALQSQKRFNTSKVTTEIVQMFLSLIIIIIQTKYNFFY